MVYFKVGGHFNGYITHEISSTSVFHIFLVRYKSRSE